MGQSVCRAVADASDMTLVASVGSADSREILQPAEVLVDFTTPEAAMDNIEWGVANGKHVIVGTSGFDERRLDEVRRLLGDRPAVEVRVVPNFCISAVLAMRFAAEAAVNFDQIDIIDLTHNGKTDAPAGTALRTAQLIREATGHGDRARSVPEPVIHSVRLKGLGAHQEVLMSRADETLIIRYDTTDRAAYMSGVLLAVRAAGRSRGLIIGLESALRRSA
jgi:4-hydroxy-tetrahydrodipicolinate reductase